MDKQDKISSVPPYSNRGAQNTLGDGLIACVDWLQVTFKVEHTVQEIIEFLGLNFSDFVGFDTGKYGWNSHLRLGHIAFYYGGSKYIHLEMTGQGCREFEQLSSLDWSTFFALILNLDVNVTRLDLAIDDFMGYFSVAMVERKVKRAEYRGRFRDKARVMTEYSLKDGSTLGKTVYFGQPTSRIQVRFYDKLQERKSKGKEFDLSHWVRTEVQLRDERAMMAFENIAHCEGNEIGKIVSGILRNYMSLLVRGKDSNKSRWKLADWWVKFLGDVEKVKLTKVHPEKTIEQTLDWFMESMSATLDMLMEAFDYNVDLIIAMLLEGRRKRNKKHEMKLANHRISKNIDFDENVRLELLKRLAEIKKAQTDATHLSPKEE